MRVNVGGHTCKEAQSLLSDKTQFVVEENNKEKQDGMNKVLQVWVGSKYCFIVVVAYLA